MTRDEARVKKRGSERWHCKGFRLRREAERDFN